MEAPWKVAIVAASVLLGGAAQANAALIVDGGLTLDTDPSAIYGQTEASPCVIGGSNCQNAATFPYTLVGPGGAGVTDTASSPTYLIADIVAVVGSNFFVGLDYNQNVDPQELFFFTADYDIGADQTFDVDTILQTNNNGVGFSDFLLSGFVIPAGATTVTFSASWFNNDGADRYFLVGEGATPVPEPASLALIGLGLLGLGLTHRRRRPSS